ncbi:TetR family transcriptional regulator [Roseomonas indoligenes]|uniref:TetR family transcriptional regulator n=1 Tax=Roseomonas indoligenes TaxID=2820811 RepID=A0A940S697_9PROT|nr:TetR family transcriptional regulator [Pararoseomonas indoligenes]MBP0493735.1 TetR family transcriptional regulator [Pararoseomonas indoligenes]
MRDAPSPALLDAFWRVVAQHGWHGTTFARIAAESGESLSDLRGRYPTPVDLLRAHARTVDQAVLEGTVPGQTGFGTARDRVFDLLMRRLDALQPHREGILRMQRDLMRDPLSALFLSPILMASMAWTLEGAGVSTAGIAGALRVQGLVGVWLSVARAWETDESVDLGPTMAALDRALDRAEKVASTLRLTEEEPALPDLNPGPVEGVDSAPPDIVDPPLADTGIMLADADAGPEQPGEGGTPGVAAAEPLPPAEPVPPSALSPEAPDAPATPTPPRKKGGSGPLSIA